MVIEHASRVCECAQQCRHLHKALVLKEKCRGVLLSVLDWLSCGHLSMYSDRVCSRRPFEVSQGQHSHIAAVNDCSIAWPMDSIQSMPKTLEPPIAQETIKELRGVVQSESEPQKDSYAFPEVMLPVGAQPSLRISNLRHG